MGINLTVIMRIAVILFISLIFTTTVTGQKLGSKKLSITTVRFGIDPIRMISLPFPEKNLDNHKIYLRGLELNTEIIFNISTSIYLEGGYEYAHRRLFNSTVDYFSNGTYLRAGLNYNMAQKKDKGEHGIGWRVGINRFEEERNIRLYGRAWNTELIAGEFTKGTTMWGEILAYSIRRLSQNEKLKNIYYGGDIRLLFMNHNKSKTKQYGEWLPGFGPKKEFSVGLHFRLVYQIPHKQILRK